MSFLGRLFGTDAAITKTFDTVSNGLDALVYTDEEKAGDAANDRKDARSMFIRWIEASQGANLARRIIALVVTSIWSIQYIASMIMSVVAVWVSNESAIKLRASVIELQSSGEAVTGAMMLVLAFYFAAPHMGSIATAAINKFSGNK